MNVHKGTLLRISQTDTPRSIAIANLDPSAENAISGGASRGLSAMGIDTWVMKEKFAPLGSK